VTDRAIVDAAVAAADRCPCDYAYWRCCVETAARHAAAQALAGVAWVELDNTGEEPRMVLTGDLETLRDLAGRIPPAKVDR
jgi:hypothetical protein